MRIKTLFIAILIFVVFLSGCTAKEIQSEDEVALSTDSVVDVTEETTQTEETAQNVYVDVVELQIEEPKNEANVVGQSPDPARPDILEPIASGKLVAENEKAIIDYSNTEDGYVMVLFTAETDKRLKTQVQGPYTTYTYNLPKGEWTVFPLSDGNGTYQIKVFQNTSDSKYSMVIAAEHVVTMSDEFAPFLRPNQYVNYSAASNAVEKAWELTRGIDDPLGKVEAIYNFTVTTLSYDNERAATVKSGYLPDLDAVLEEKKGICFDYAALMTGMLRSQGIPCKMVFGYAGSAYHAWISVWTEAAGWVDGVIFFDGTAWQRLDPTFASSGDQSEEIMSFIGNGANYKEKYFY